MTVKEQAEQKGISGTIDQLVKVGGLYKPTNSVLPLNIQSFDKAMDGGTREGELIVISGPTGQGKTTYAQNLSCNLSKNGIASLWFSYEMNPWYLMMNFQKIIREMSLHDLWVYTPIELYERDLKFIEGEIKEGIREKVIKVVFIDHLHYLIDLKSSVNSSLLIGGIVRELKQMAIRNNVVIFLIAHTKKIYTDERLDLSSIRDSSLISQESDYVFLVERRKKEKQQFNESQETEWTNQTRISLAKNRRTGDLFYMDFTMENNKLIPITQNYKKL